MERYCKQKIQGVIGHRIFKDKSSTCVKGTNLNKLKRSTLFRLVPRGAMTMAHSHMLKQPLLVILPWLKMTKHWRADCLHIYQQWDRMMSTVGKWHEVLRDQWIVAFKRRSSIKSPEIRGREQRHLYAVEIPADLQWKQRDRTRDRNSKFFLHDLIHMTYAFLLIQWLY